MLKLDQRLMLVIDLELLPLLLDTLPYMLLGLDPPLVGMLLDP